MSEFDSDENFESVFVPNVVLQEAKEAVEKVIPSKSKVLYEREYMLFCKWRTQKQAKGVDERIILAYISERSKNTKASSLWSYYSQIKKMLLVKENVDISRFHQVKAFLKQHSVGHRPKKSKVFTREDLEKFLDTASDAEYLLIKVVFIVGVAGGCRIGELVNMSVEDVDDRGSVLVVQIPDTKTYKKRVFTVVNGSNSVHAIDVFRKYRNLRPGHVEHKRLFVNYRNEKCTVQPVGLNSFSKMSQKIAKFLCLPNPEEYTGHSFRRSSATLLADAGADLSVLKRHGGWSSSSFAEGYVEDSLMNKIDISKKILGEGGSGVTAVTVVVSSHCSTSAEQIRGSLTIDEKNTDLSVENTFLPLGDKAHIANLKDCNIYFNYNNK